MYKVFFNQKPLILTNEIQEFSDTEPFIFIKYSNASQIIKALKSTKNSKVYLYHKNFDKLWKTFTKQFPVIEAAGGLVERTDNKLLFIFRNDKWDLPKGVLEKGETFEKAAIREVEEETGISNLKLCGKLQTTYHTYPFQGKTVLKPSHWYKMEHTGTGVLVPQTEEDITELRWVDKIEAAELAQKAFPSIREMVEKYYL